MRKSMLVVMSVILGLSLTSASFATTTEKPIAARKQEASPTIRGTITAVNATANQISIQQDGAKQPMTVTVPANEIAALKEGVRVKITLKEGTTDQAESVKVVVPRKKKK